MKNPQKEKREIDKMAVDSYSLWDKSFVFIKKEKIKIWYVIFAGAFIAGMVASLAWSVSSDIHQSSSAAGKGNIPDMGNIPDNMCVVNPISAHSSEPITIYIKCGKNIKEAFYKWEGMKPVAIKKKGAQTQFTAERSMGLQVYGEFHKNRKTYGYGYGYGSNEFMQNYYYYAQGSETCIDTDGGKDYYTKGKVTGVASWGAGLPATTFEDYCFGSPTYPGAPLNEISCGNDNLVYQESFNCPNGCQDGACISTNTSKLYLGDDNVYYMCDEKPITPQTDYNSENDNMIFDLGSVKIINDTFFSDKDGVYYIYSWTYDCSFLKLQDVDPGSFQILNRNYVKDKNVVYYIDTTHRGWPNLEIIENADAPTFEVSEEEYYAKDKNNTYFRGEITAPNLNTQISAAWAGEIVTLINGLNKTIGIIDMGNWGDHSATIETINVGLLSSFTNTATSSLKIYSDSTQWGTLLATYYFFPGEKYSNTNITEFTNVVIQPNESKRFYFTLDIFGVGPGDYLSVSIEADDIEWSDGVNSGITSVHGLPLTGVTHTN